MPSPQAHLQNALDSLTTTAAVVITGTAGATAAWMANLDAISKVLAVISMAFNIAWIIAQWWWKTRRGREWAALFSGRGRGEREPVGWVHVVWRVPKWLEHIGAWADRSDADWHVSFWHGRQKPRPVLRASLYRSQFHLSLRCSFGALTCGHFLYVLYPFLTRTL